MNDEEAHNDKNSIDIDFNHTEAVAVLNSNSHGSATAALLKSKQATASEGRNLRACGRVV